MMQKIDNNKVYDMMCMISYWNECLIGPFGTSMPIHKMYYYICYALIYNTPGIMTIADILYRTCI